MSHRSSLRTRRWLRLIAATSAMMRPASQRVRPPSTSCSSFARSPPARSSAATRTIEQNILGGMCARVCPTETLCEEVCVREIAEGKPVQIGRLQRYATDIAMAQDKQFYQRAEPTGRKIAVVGAGPAGLACAHRLAMPRTRGDDLRSEAQGRRAERVRDRRLQDGRRLRPGRGELVTARSAASRSRLARRSAATSRWRTSSQA